MKLPTSTLTLQTNKPLPPNPEKLRGAISTQNPENAFLHQHMDSSLIYRYPRIQYHILDGQAVIQGYHIEGKKTIIQLFNTLDKITLRNQSHWITSKKLKINNEEFGYSKKPEKYRFITPWLALNSENYKKFKASSQIGKKRLLENILNGNILSASKSLGYTVENRITTTLIWARPIKCMLKGTPIIGFKGAFETSFTLPTLFGLGKSVSRGFGAITSLQEE